MEIREFIDGETNGKTEIIDMNKQFNEIREAVKLSEENDKKSNITQSNKTKVLQRLCDSFNPNAHTNDVDVCLNIKILCLYFAD